MKLITTSGNKTFKIIPREFTVGTLNLKLTSESTNKTITVNATSVIDGNYISFNAVFGALTESDFYILEEYKYERFKDSKFKHLHNTRNC